MSPVFMKKISLAVCTNTFCRLYAASGTKEDGEFYTPACVVQLIAEIIEPYSGVVYDIKTPRLIQFNYSSAGFAA